MGVQAKHVISVDAQVEFRQLSTPGDFRLQQGVPSTLKFAELVGVQAKHVIFVDAQGEFRQLSKSFAQF